MSSDGASGAGAPQKRCAGFNMSSQAPTAQALQNKRARLAAAQSKAGGAVGDAAGVELPADFSKELEQLDVHSGDETELWPRSKAPALDPENASLVFQQMEIDEEYVPSTNTVTARLFGVTEQGNSVVCYVQGFYPYFYCPAPAGFNERDIPLVVAELNRLSLSSGGGGGGGDSQSRDDGSHRSDAVVGIEMCMKEPLFGYHGNVKAPFFRIAVRNPRLMRPVTLAVKRGFNVPGVGTYAGTPYESNLEFTIRFMVDTGIVGASWVELPAGKYSARAAGKTFCQYEVDVHFQDLIAHEPVGEWSKVAPLRILSLDIECAGRPGVFPEAKIDPVIQIANVVTVQGQRQPFIRNVFTLDT
ncbi:DNA polymerase delta catalytic subunit, partial [Coemansia nantahalensis]